MMKMLKVTQNASIMLLACLSFSISETSYANETSTVEPLQLNPPVPLNIVLPEGEPLLDDNDEPVAILFSPEEYKLILTIYLGYQQYSMNYARWRELQRLHEVEIVLKDQQIQLFRDIKEEYRADRQDMYDLWKANKRDMSHIGWLLGGTGGGLLVGIVLGLAVAQ